MLNPIRDLTEDELTKTRKLIGRITYYEKRRKVLKKTLENNDTPSNRYKLADIDEKLTELNKSISMIYIGPNPNEPEVVKPKLPENVPAPIKRPRGRPRKTPAPQEPVPQPQETAPAENN